MFASHTYLGGMKQEWWQVFQSLLDSGKVRRAADFDEWLAPVNGVCLRVPMSLIPVNREVQYTRGSKTVVLALGPLTTWPPP